MTEAVLTADGIRLGVTASSREDAVRLCGEHLLAVGAIERPYIDAMWEREQRFSSYVGEQVAIPHGTDDSRRFVKHAQLVLLRFDTPVDWDGETVRIAIGIASAGSEHMDVLGALAEALMREHLREVLLTSEDVDEITSLLTEAFK